MIEEDEDGDPKVKMYAKEDGSFNGEALVVYFKEDSVTLAINLLDDAELRLGQPSSAMRVAKADFAHKSHGSGQEARPRRIVDKKKVTKRIGKMQKCVIHQLIVIRLTWPVRKLEEWGEDDGFGPMSNPQDATTVNHNNRVVVLKHLFTLQGLEEDASLLLDLKEDVREECASLGEVTNVVLYDASCFSFVPLASFSP